MKTTARMSAMALVLSAALASTSALGASDGKTPGKKGAPCNVQECKRVFDDAGMVCTNPKPKPSQGELGQRCQCDCLDEGGARKKKR